MSKKILKSIIGSHLVFTILLFSFSSLNLRAQSTLGTVVDKIIARVDNYIVLKSELESAYQSYIAEGNPPSTVTECALLNRLIMNKLMVAKANIDSILVTDGEVSTNTDRRIQMILQNSGNSVTELEEIYAKTMDEIKLDLRDQIREQMLINKMAVTITGEIAITPSEVRRFFNKIPENEIPFYSADVEVAQLMVIPKINKIQKAKAINTLLGLRMRLLAGEDFHELAKKYSEDPSVQYNGGEIGYVGRGSMVNAYEAMAFKTKEGEISEPFESSFGFHILQLLDRRGNEYNSRHILISATPSAENIEQTKHFLDSLRTLILNHTISFEKAVKEYSDDQGTKSYGGFFTNTEGSTQVSIKELDPTIYFTLDTMKVGDISPPIVYRSGVNKDAVRILYFKSKTRPHQANLESDWDKIRSAALAEKKDATLNTWFRQEKGSVFISVDPSYNYCDILE